MQWGREWGPWHPPLRMGTSPQLKQKGLEESGEVCRISWKTGAGVREEIFVGNGVLLGREG